MISIKQLTDSLQNVPEDTKISFWIEREEGDFGELVDLDRVALITSTSSEDVEENLAISFVLREKEFECPKEQCCKKETSEEEEEDNPIV